MEPLFCPLFPGLVQKSDHVLMVITSLRDRWREGSIRKVPSAQYEDMHLDSQDPNIKKLSALSYDCDHSSGRMETEEPLGCAAQLV